MSIFPKDVFVYGFTVGGAAADLKAGRKRAAYVVCAEAACKGLTYECV